jgi:hypothetical protein
VVELRSNLTAKGSKTVEDGVLPTNHAEHETLEITQGFNSWFSGSTDHLIIKCILGRRFSWIHDHAARLKALSKEVGD